MFLIEERNERLGKQLLRMDSDAMFAGVVTGHNPGEVWVDDYDHPSSALVWSGGLGGFCFMGCPSSRISNATLERLIDDEIIPFLKEKDTHYFEFSVDGEEWQPIIQDTLGNRGLKDSYQYVYKSDLISGQYQGNGNPVFPESFTAVRLDAQQLHEWGRNGAVNADFLVQYIKQFWGTVNDFLAEGHGYAAITDRNVIASLAISSAKFGMTHTIGVETLEDYKRLGLSSSLVKLLLNDFHEHGIMAWWDCTDSNIASQKTAEKAGLMRTHRYKIYWFTF
ncbi:GNAT family N-acetyltransferase [Paenibacillus sp. N3/727]|uniref:GNAT family N-acetyltransferase n=1 Tax=Paenibacillus sp. N3/727 TaxID=2925845 RepID=UPI001F52D53A|nr:GNAT family N-acetyltransferase [Paenibacillus sp. N3/727]UNK19634.1 GNAT family N-acetyltransferase [Paenibacillus sp. N3/727]